MYSLPNSCQHSANVGMIADVKSKFIVLHSIENLSWQLANAKAFAKTSRHLNSYEPYKNMSPKIKSIF